MTKHEFKSLFLSALEIAAENASKHFNIDIPRNFQIELHGAGYPGKLIPDVDMVVDILYLDEDLSYRIIDIAVVAINTSRTMSRVFVRPSGHKPVPYASVWNNPEGSGPFKQIIAGQIKVVSDESFE